MKKDSAPIAYFIERDITPRVLSQEDKGGSLTVNSTDSLSFTITGEEGNESPSLLLDFGRNTTGFLIFNVSPCAGGELLLEYGPVRGDLFIKETLKIDSSSKSNYIIHKEFLALRFLKISLLDTLHSRESLTITLEDLHLHFSACPVDGIRRFFCNEEGLNKIWELGAYTNLICLQKSTLSSGQYGLVMYERKHSPVSTPLVKEML